MKERVPTICFMIQGLLLNNQLKYLGATSIQVENGGYASKT